MHACVPLYVHACACDKRSEKQQPCRFAIGKDQSGKWNKPLTPHSFLVSFVFKKIILFIYLLLAVLGLHSYMGFSLAVASGGFLLQWLLLFQGEGSRVRGPLQSLRLLGSSTGSAVMVHRISCSAAMWDLPGSGIEPVSPALAGRFFTTEPPEKPLIIFYKE